MYCEAPISVDFRVPVAWVLVAVCGGARTAELFGVSGWSSISDVYVYVYVCAYVYG